MKLSEAIRLGATLRPQARGVLRTHPGRGHKASTCAIGAAFEALGVKVTRQRLKVPGIDTRGKVIPAGEMVENRYWPSEFLEFVHIKTTCPLCGMVSVVLKLIPHLNDQHLGSREFIATWIEIIEKQQEEMLEHNVRVLRFAE